MTRRKTRTELGTAHTSNVVRSSLSNGAIHAEIGLRDGLLKRLAELNDRLICINNSCCKGGPFCTLFHCTSFRFYRLELQ